MTVYVKTPINADSSETLAWREAVPYVKVQGKWVVIDPDTFKIDFCKVGTTAIVQESPLPGNNYLEEPLYTYVKVDGEWKLSHPTAQTSLQLRFKYSEPEDVFITIITGGAKGGENFNESDWRTFRQRHPTNKFYLVVSDSSTKLFIPPNFDGEVLIVPRDQNNENPRPNWFNLFNLQNIPAGAKIQVRFDSLPWLTGTTGRVYSQASINDFRAACEQAGHRFFFTSGGSAERWAGAHLGNHRISFKLSTIRGNGTLAGRGIINWGDGNTETIVDHSLATQELATNSWRTFTHEYATPGEYIVSIDTVGIDRTIAGIEVSDITLREILNILPAWDLKLCNFGNTTIKTLPSELFANNKNIHTLNSCFSKTLIKEIPQNFLRSTVNILSMRDCFSSCYNLQNIPSDLFKYNTKGIHLEIIFSQCANLTTIPSDLFNNPLIDPGPGPYRASGIFKNSGLTIIPANLFEHFVTTTDFSEAFYGTKIQLIPPALFNKCVEATNMASIFAETNIVDISPLIFRNTVKVTNLFKAFRSCVNLIAIPGATFSSLTNLTDCGGVFQSCTSLNSIPANLLQYNTKITNVSYMFYATNISEIPAGLFNNNTSITNFTATFSHCFELTTIPTDLFKTNTLAQLFTSIFENCKKLETFPDNLFNYNTSAYNFIRAFAGCLLLKKSANLLANPYLWNKNPRPRGSGFASGAGVLQGAIQKLNLPTGVTITNTTVDSFTIQWNAVSQATNYTVYFSETIYFETYTAHDTTSTSYTFNTLTQGSTFYLTIKASNSTNESNYSDVASITLASLIAPQNITFTDITLTSFKAQWSRVEYANTYKVELSNTSNFSTIIETINTSNTNKVFTNLLSNTTYYVRVKAIKGINESTFVNSSVTTAQLLPPTNIQTTSTFETITITWDNAEFAATYRVKTTSTEPIIEYVVRENQITFNQLFVDTTYNFSIRSETGSIVSSEVTFTETTQVVASPTNLTFSDVTVDSFKVQWVRSPDTNTSRVELSIFSDFRETVERTTINSSVTFSNLLPATTYYVRVFAIKDGYRQLESAPVSSNIDTSQESSVCGLRYDKIIGCPNDVSIFEAGSVVESGVHTEIDFSDIGMQRGYIWTGYILAPEDGEYTFKVWVDNAVKFYLNGELIINDWRPSSSNRNLYSSSYYLLKGVLYPVRIVFCNLLGPGRMHVYWSTDNSNYTIIPSENYRTPDYQQVHVPPDTGLIVSHYTLPNESVPVNPISTMIPDDAGVWNLPIDYDLYDHYSHYGTKTKYAFIWQGFILAPQTSNYRFATKSDDGVRLYLNGNKIIENWTLHGRRTDYSNYISLEQNKLYHIKLEYFQGPLTDGVIQLYWLNTSGLQETIIPTNSFRRYPRTDSPLLDTYPCT